MTGRNFNPCARKQPSTKANRWTDREAADFCSGSYQIRDNKSCYVPEARRCAASWSRLPFVRGFGVIGETAFLVSRCVTIVPAQFIPRLCAVNALRTHLHEFRIVRCAPGYAGNNGWNVERYSDFRGYYQCTYFNKHVHYKSYTLM